MYVTKEEAINHLKNNNVVAIPTETVYGMAADIKSDQALKKIFSVKDRPFFDPLIIHVNSIDMAKKFTTNWNDIAQKLAEDFWPGPLTLVINKTESLNPIITSGLDKVGIRMPAHPLTLELIAELDSPLAAPSANKFKKTSPTCAEHVEVEFNGQVPVLDGGRTEFGIESTVVGIFDDKVEIYRPGVITKDDLEDSIGKIVTHKESPVAPGQLKHHYMPNIPITITFNPEIDINQFENHDVWILENDPILVARELYQRFRDAQNKESVGLLLILKKDYLDDEKWQGVINRVQKAKTYEI